MSQFLLCIVNWKLNRMLRDTELLLAMAALTVSMGSSRLLASSLPFWQAGNSSRDLPSTQELTDFLTPAVLGNPTFQPSSPRPAVNDWHCGSDTEPPTLQRSSSSNSTNITSDTNVDSLTDFPCATDQLQPGEALSTISHRNQYWHCGGDAEPFTLQRSSSRSTSITSDTSLDSLTDFLCATDQLQSSEALSTISHRSQYRHCVGDAELFAYESSSSSISSLTEDLTDISASSSLSLCPRPSSLSADATPDAPTSPLVLCTPPPQLQHRPIPDLDLGPAERRNSTSLPLTPRPSSLSTSFQLTAASAIFVSQAGSSKEDSQHLRPSPSSPSSPSRPSSPSTSLLLKAAGRNAAPLDGPTPKERYLTRDPADISAPAFWALSPGTQAALHNTQAAHIQGTSSSSIALLPECCNEWWFGSPDDYCISAHRKQQHRQRLQDYRKLKQLKFSLLYPPRRKLKPRLGFTAWELTPQDAETDANIQDFISEAINRAARLIKSHESHKALWASAKPIRVQPKQPFGFPGHLYQDPIIRLPLDQQAAQYAVFDPMD
jgi:hypothetical protein